MCHAKLNVDEKLSKVKTGKRNTTSTHVIVRKKKMWKRVIMICDRLDPKAIAAQR